MQSIRCLALVVFAIVLTGCAAIAHGPQQNIVVITDPAGAIVTVGSQQISTPGVLTLRRKDTGLELRIEKEGYLTHRVRLTRETSHKAVWLDMGAVVAGLWIGGEVGNRAAPDREYGCSSSGGIGICSSSNNLSEIAVGAVVGAAILGGVAFGIDYATGAAYCLDPPQVTVTLEPLPSAERPRGDP